jgi:dimethylglycine dehydrogenase
MRFVNADKDFLGKAATLANRDNLPWVCAYLEIEPDGVEDGHGGEAVRLDGVVVGSTSSVVYAHSCGKILAFAYIKPHAAAPGTALEILIAGKARSGKVLAAAAYDPESRLPRSDATRKAVA